MTELLWQKRVKIAGTHWPIATPKLVPSPRLAGRLDVAHTTERELAAQFAAAARRMRNADAFRERHRLRDAEWKEESERRARQAYSRELTRSFRAGIAAEKKAAALAADDANHKAKATPTRPAPSWRPAADHFQP